MTETTSIKSLSYDEARQWVVDNLPADAGFSGALPASLTAIEGYLFAISQAPVPVSASQWIGELLALFGEEVSSADTLNAVLSFQRHIEQRSEAQQYPVPNTTGMDAIAQIEPGSPLNDWSLGFEAGYEQVRDTWTKLIPVELRSELDSQLFALTFFSTPDNARRFLAQRDSAMRPEQLADQVLTQFPKAVDLHARLSISVGAVAQAAVEEKKTARVGRNDPCPCGSGKKYKQCCLQ